MILSKIKSFFKPRKSNDIIKKNEAKEAKERREQVLAKRAKRKAERVKAKRHALIEKDKDYIKYCMVECLNVFPHWDYPNILECDLFEKYAVRSIPIILGHGSSVVVGSNPLTFYNNLGSGYLAQITSTPTTGAFYSEPLYEYHASQSDSLYELFQEVKKEQTKIKLDKIKSGYKNNEI